MADFRIIYRDHNLGILVRLVSKFFPGKKSTQYVGDVRLMKFFFGTMRSKRKKNRILEYFLVIENLCRFLPFVVFSHVFFPF